MKWWVIGGMAGLICGLVGVAVYRFMPSPVSDKPEQTVIDARPLEKYAISSLAMRSFGAEINLDEAIATAAAFQSRKFHFDSDGKRVTGLAHIPLDCDGVKKCPTIIQLRGYADPAVYTSGYGTYRSAEEFARQGFISLAPDFLGYGGSASPSADVFEARFETYTTALNLAAAAEVWERGNGQVGLWGHSNGGHIALTILEISGKEYPTVLWAPVTAGFPYSILFYMDANEEGDKNLRKKLTEFEDKYDANKYNLLNYLERINAPIQLHQGGEDVSVPVQWNRSLTAKLRKLDKEINYFEYPLADHNLLPDWNTVVERSSDFYKREFGLDD